MEAWEDLQNLVQTCLTLHTTYSNLAHLAQAYGFWAELALHRSHWQEAKQAAQTALDIMATASGEQRQNYSYYRLLLALSQQQLGESTEAISHLERVRRYEIQGDPQLYIQILDTLRFLYFGQKQYLEAFRLKQERRSIQQQYGFRAFVGASRLKPQRQVGAIISKADHQEMVAQEITASNRRQDVDELTKRIRDEKKHQLIVIYGQSGVGKSSVVEAGLVPALPRKPSGTRDVLPVLLRVYTDWIKGLGDALARALEETAISNRLTAESLNLEVLEYQLRWNEEHNLLTVLIFDQFEEFFFVCKKIDEQKQFFEFLRNCLKLSSVKVVLSIREDYLHLLLRGSHAVELNETDKAILGNILDKDILYRIGNLSHEETKSIIRSLTKRSQVQLEAGLIDELVKDLADELGEVRPIELQVVGAQLQTENIRTLAEILHQSQ